MSAATKTKSGNKKKASNKKKSSKKTTTKATPETTTDETNENPEETTEEVLMSVTLGCETYEVDINVEEIVTKHNIRPINRQRANEIAQDIIERGLDRKPWLVENQGGDNEFWTLDGGHRVTALAIVQKKNPERFAELFPTGQITAECRGPFETMLEYHLAQVQLNEGQESLSRNAVDAGFACAKLEAEGANQATIAKALTKSAAWVSRHLNAHHNVISQIKTMVKNGKLSGKTLLDAAQGTEAQQKKLLEKLQKALKGLKGKEYKQTERQIVESWVQRLKRNQDGKARFPKKLPKKELAHAMFDLHGRYANKKKSELSEYHIECRGMLKGIALAFGADDADSDDFDIEEWFRNSFGREITSDENAM